MANNRFRPGKDVMYRCLHCGEATWLVSGTPLSEALCWKCQKHLRFLPCFGCGGACSVGQQYCARCKANRHGPLSQTPVERHVEEQEVEAVTDDLYRIERELRDAL